MNFDLADSDQIFGLSVEETDDRKEAAVKELTRSLGGAETRQHCKADLD